MIDLFQKAHPNCLHSELVCLAITQYRPTLSERMNTCPTHGVCRRRAHRCSATLLTWKHGRDFANWTPDQVPLHTNLAYDTFYFSRCLFHRFCYEDWDETLGFILVLLIRWVCFHCDLPEPFSLD